MGAWNLKIPATVFFLIVSFSVRAALNDEFIAAVEGLASVEKVASLIEAGADVNAVFPNKCNGGTALMCAAQSNSGGYESKVRLLLSHGADVEIRNGAGQTALMAAATNLERIGGEAVFELLLDHGANVNAETLLGNTPLHFAACDDLAWSALSEPTVVPSITSPALGGASSSYKGIQTLLRSGADPAAVNQDGDTPLHIVLQTYKLSFSSAADAVRALLQAGADATQKDGEGIAPLHFVVAEEAEAGDVIRELLDAGADPDLKDSKGKTPLHIAAKLDRDENAKALLKGGADPNLKDSKGDTPLHIVVTSESSDVVDALLVAKADPCIKNAEGYTPYQRADEETYIHQALGRAGGYDAACDERREEKEESTSEKQQTAAAEKSNESKVANAMNDADFFSKIFEGYEPGSYGVVKPRGLIQNVYVVSHVRETDINIKRCNGVAMKSILGEVRGDLTSERLFETVISFNNFELPRGDYCTGTKAYYFKNKEIKVYPGRSFSYESIGYFNFPPLATGRLVYDIVDEGIYEERIILNLVHYHATSEAECRKVTDGKGKFQIKDVLHSDPKINGMRQFHCSVEIYSKKPLTFKEVF